ncbi:TM2 domain-containing protein [Streptococcus sp. DD12]|uniref:TM2 domain-containing protein n=1 Tax=Streptococcus sp. DD12 TaxID=1777880 RepID=UPI0007925626|nr:TM2 domain-containing protein [Streptococcus sp. DD12]KXT76806.1 hypothetical protein STRDD12_00211 [Streptococcus sp. DD12]
MSFSEHYFYSQLDLFPAQQLPQIRESLSEVTKEQEDRILATEFKSPTRALLLSLSAGYLGLDRYYNEDIGLGVGKSVLFGLGVLLGIIPVIGIIGLLLLLADAIWALVDWFLIVKAVKAKNGQRLTSALNGYVGLPAGYAVPGQEAFGQPTNAPFAGQPHQVPFQPQAQEPFVGSQTPQNSQESNL